MKFHIHDICRAALAEVSLCHRVGPNCEPWPSVLLAENPYERPVIGPRLPGRPCAICGAEDPETAGQLGAWRASMARLAVSAEIHPSICASMLEELRAVQLAAKVRARGPAWTCP